MTCILWAAFAVVGGYGSHVTTWPDGHTAALTMTFDDGCVDHQLIADPELTARGLHGTFALNPGLGNWNTAGPIFQAIAAHGHELADHTMRHQRCLIQAPEEDAAAAPPNSNFHSLEELDADCVTVKTLLNARQSRPTASFVYPGGVYTPETRGIVANHFICARLSTSDIHINPPSPANMFMLQPLYIGGAQPTVTDWCDYTQVANFFATTVSLLMANHGWTIEEYHDTDCPGYAAFNLDAWRAHLDQLATLSQSTLWVAPQGDVARYIYERNASVITVLTEEYEAVMLSVDDGLDGEVFDMPVTIETTVPVFWGDDITVTQGTTSLAHGLDPQTQNVRFNVVPNGQPVLLSVSVTIEECLGQPFVSLPCQRYDLDHDSDVDSWDYEFYLALTNHPSTTPFSACMAGPDEPVPCGPFDLDHDGDEDLMDFVLFARLR